MSFGRSESKSLEVAGRGDTEAARVLNLCETEIASRGIQPTQKAAKRNRRSGITDGVRTVENELSHKLGQFGLRLLKEYDLSPETAKAKSNGTKRFVAHNLLQSDNTAKIGGLQRSGRCAIDRYISYRIRESIISLNIFQLADHDSENLHFQVFGPKELLPDGEPLTSLRPGLVGEPEMKRYPWGKRFDRFEDAQAAFEKIISHFAKNQ
ncbi:hypothetical protein [Aestuariivirga sp.]|uniref:hypothetical protein n=1 Tax=Aestuariivirga sp. TaxID=2650926 RepID=UPI0039E46091